MMRRLLWSEARAAVVGVCMASVVIAAHSTTAGTSPAPSLWDAPAHLSDRDLYDGPWGARRAPDPQVTYTFVHPKRHGTNPGLVVRDPWGREWHVKQQSPGHIGDEGPVEVVLSRVLSALGYHQPPVYYLRSFRLADKSGTHVEAGGRFRLQEPSMKPRGPWQWRHNPFAGTRPYEGLLVVLLAFNSWDLKDSNNTMYDVTQDGRVERWYTVRDLGGALGESGRHSPRRNNVERFEQQTFIRGVSHGFVEFTYHGWQPEIVRHQITIDDVQWAMRLLAGLSDRQWHDAFRAGGYPDDLSERFIRKVKSNIADGLQLEPDPSALAERRH